MDGSFKLLGFTTDHGIQWYSILLLLTPLIYRLLTDGHRILVDEEEVNHGKQFTLTLFIGLVCSYIVWRVEPVKTIFQPALLSASFFWLTFDHLLNLIRGLHIFYIDANAISGEGPSSWADRQYAKYGILPVLFAKVWLFLVALCVYFAWTIIIGERTFS